MNPQTTQLIEALNNPKYALLLLVLTAWSLMWKGFALWKSAKSNQRNWFIAILLINTFGILEIVYLFYFARPKIVKNQEKYRSPTSKYKKGKKDKRRHLLLNFQIFNYEL